MLKFINQNLKNQSLIVKKFQMLKMFEWFLGHPHLLHHMSPTPLPSASWHDTLVLQCVTIHDVQTVPSLPYTGVTQGTIHKYSIKESHCIHETKLFEFSDTQILGFWINSTGAKYLWCWVCQKNIASGSSVSPEAISLHGPPKKLSKHCNAF